MNLVPHHCIRCQNKPCSCKIPPVLNDAPLGGAVISEQEEKVKLFSSLQERTDCNRNDSVEQPKRKKREGHSSQKKEHRKQNRKSNVMGDRREKKSSKSKKKQEAVMLDSQCCIRCQPTPCCCRHRTTSELSASPVGKSTTAQEASELAFFSTLQARAHSENHLVEKKERADRKSKKKKKERKGEKKSEKSSREKKGHKKKRKKSERSEKLEVENVAPQPCTRCRSTACSCDASDLKRDLINNLDEDRSISGTSVTKSTEKERHSIIVEPAEKGECAAGGKEEGHGEGILGDELSSCKKNRENIESSKLKREKSDDEIKKERSDKNSTSSKILCANHPDCSRCPGSRSRCIDSNQLDVIALVKSGTDQKEAKTAAFSVLQLRAIEGRKSSSDQWMKKEECSTKTDTSDHEEGKKNKDPSSSDQSRRQKDTSDYEKQLLPSRQRLQPLIASKKFSPQDVDKLGVHEGVYCNGQACIHSCQEIVGPRYRCETCSQLVDLCESCYQSGQAHDPTHKFQKLARPDSVPILLYPRQSGRLSSFNDPKHSGSSSTIQNKSPTIALSKSMDLPAARQLGGFIKSTKAKELSDEFETPAARHMGGRTNSTKAKELRDEFEIPSARHLSSRTNSTKAKELRDEFEIPSARHLGSRTNSTKVKELRDEFETPAARHLGSRTNSTKAKELRDEFETPAARHLGSRTNSTKAKELRDEFETPAARHLGSRTNSTKAKELRDEFEAPAARQSSGYLKSAKAKDLRDEFEIPATRHLGSHTNSSKAKELIDEFEEVEKSASVSDVEDPQHSRRNLSRSKKSATNVHSGNPSQSMNRLAAVHSGLINDSRQEKEPNHESRKSEKATNHSAAYLRSTQARQPINQVETLERVKSVENYQRRRRTTFSRKSTDAVVGGVVNQLTERHAIHVGIYCNGPGCRHSCHEIAGPRYQCDTCSSLFDLCERCYLRYSRKAHDPTHTFKMLLRPDSISVLLSPQEDVPTTPNQKHASNRAESSPRLQKQNSSSKEAVRQSTSSQASQFVGQKQESNYSRRHRQTIPQKQPQQEDTNLRGSGRLGVEALTAQIKNFQAFPAPKQIESEQRVSQTHQSRNKASVTEHLDQLEKQYPWWSDFNCHLVPSGVEGYLENCVEGFVSGIVEGLALG